MAVLVPLFSFTPFWSNDLDTGATYTQTDWHHWAGTYNAKDKSRKIYRDGIEVASHTATANYQGSGILCIAGGCVRLDRERPHLLQGVRTRLAAKVALHNFCIWLNCQLDRPNMAFADLHTS